MLNFIAPAVGSLLGGMFSGYGAYRGARQTNQANLAQAREVMAHEANQAEILRKWQEGMANTAISRSQYDMKRAGLNPILAIAKPAATPAGAMGRGHQAQIRSPIEAGITSGMGVARGIAETNVAIETAEKIFKETDLVDAQEWTEVFRQQLVAEEAQLKRAAFDEKMMTIDLLREELKIRKQYARITDSQFGAAMRALEVFSRSVLGGGSMVPKGGAR